MRSRLALAFAARERIAVIRDLGDILTYGELHDQATTLGARLGDAPSLVVIESENLTQVVIAYVAVLLRGHAAMLVHSGDDEYIDRIKTGFRPEWHFSCRDGDWDLRPVAASETGIHADLAVMLSTSGTTGAVKFVKLSSRNVAANAASIIEYLGITPADRGLLSLPIHYSYGMSILNSHLCAGAAVLLTGRSVIDATFWDFARTHRASSFSGVPYSYELLDGVGFADMDLPDMKVLTQAGGRLPRHQVLRYASLADQRGWKFFVMYGQTEASPRISYVPHDRILDHPGSIGRSIPGGKLKIIDSNGVEITSHGVEGELVYEGPNVMMGYAEVRNDLHMGPSIESLKTGDLAVLEASGLFRVTGRLSRFLKLFGLRIALDEIEILLGGRGYRAVCGGNDSRLVVLTLDPGKSEEILSVVREKTGLPASAVRVQAVSEYPLLPSGKVDYRSVGSDAAGPADATAVGHDFGATNPSQQAGGSSVARTLLGRLRRTFQPKPPQDIASLYAQVLGSAAVPGEASFNSLGGDSMTFVEASLGLEQLLGYLPERWEELSVTELQQLRPRHATLHAVETATLLRCMAIIAVVAGHFRLFSFSGGAYLLFVVAGYNFSRFQVIQSDGRGSMAPIVRLVRRIAIPTLLAFLLLQLKFGYFDVLQLMFLGNFRSPEELKVGFWFIAVLMQLIVFMALLMSIPKVRSLMVTRGFEFYLAAVLLASVTALAMPSIWNTDHLYNRVPHMMLWMFLLGACIYQATGPRQQVLISAVVLTVSLLFFEGVKFDEWDLSSALIWVVSGALALQFFRTIGLPSPIHRMVQWIGGASMFIFITHGFFRPALHKIGIDGGALVDLVLAIVFGVLTWMVWEAASRRYSDQRQRLAPVG